MNIQIYGTKKCFDTKKAERYFKERRIPFQRIDLADKGMSRGELQNVCRAVGGLHVKGVWQMFAEITADKLDYIIQLGIEDELEDDGLLEEDDALGLTE